MATLNEIAREVGLSTSTVSKVINQRKDVSSETRERVMAVITRLGPPKSLRIGPDMVGIFTPIITREGIETPSPFFSMVLQGIFDVVFDYGLNLEIVSLQHMPKNENEFSMFCRDHRTCAAIYVLTTDQDDFIIPFSRIVPTVAVGAKYGEDVDYVRTNNLSSGRKAVQYLLELGHQRIGVVTNDLRYIDHRERIDGYRAALRDAGFNADTLPMLDVQYLANKMIGIIDWLSDLRRGPEPPTAIVATNDLVAMHTLEALRAMGLSVPGDISLVGHDDDPISTYLDPPLTTIRQYNREMGRQAVKRLLQMLNGQALEDRDRGIILEGDLVVRRSCRRLEAEANTDVAV